MNDKIKAKFQDAKDFVQKYAVEITLSAAGIGTLVATTVLVREVHKLNDTAQWTIKAHDAAIDRQKASIKLAELEGIPYRHFPGIGVMFLRDNQEVS